MHVVATAGHVDHGKSTLVRALTGTDPDRLAEERRRGLTIELGYCWTDLAGVGEVAFVDVPGHERFIATTLAGIGPVPVVMLVVAADDPWMPQAEEHLAAIDALGVRHGLLVVTRCDLADPAPVLAEARARLAHTGLRDAPAVVVSGATGAGLDELRTTLAGLLTGLPAPAAGADVRLWVDRRFHVRGAGTVVTGTLPAGTIAVGDSLATGSGAVVRVRSLEALEVTREQVSGVARVALNVTGDGAVELGRGGVLLTPQAWAASTLVDVRLDRPDRSGELPDQPLMHLGTAVVAVRARPLGHGFARLRLDRALPLRVGDRVLLRDPGSRQLWAADVVDPVPPSLSRRGAANARAEALATRDGSLAAELDLRGPTRLTDLRRLGLTTASASASDEIVRAGEWLLGPRQAAALSVRLTALVDEAGGDGLTVPEAARRLGLPAAELIGPLVRDPVRIVDGRLRGETQAALPAAAEAALAGLRRHLAEQPYVAPDAATARALGLDPATVAVLAAAGLALKLPDGLVLLHGADDQAVEVLGELPAPFTVAAARQALGTSRRVVLPLLAHLDRTGRTVRLADDTRRLRR